MRALACDSRADGGREVLASHPAAGEEINGLALSAAVAGPTPGSLSGPACGANFVNSMFRV